MALHCRCPRCQACPAPGTSFAEPEQILGESLDTGYALAGQTGFFVHLANANRENIVSREIFQHGDDKWVGASGRYFSSLDAIQARSDKGLENLDISNTVTIIVPINAGNRERMYKTRSGNILQSAELTVRLDCGGTLATGTGVITPGTVGRIRSCEDPGQAGCCIVQ